MSETILVAYATRYGSTREAAERVALTLRKAGLAVTLEPVGQVRSLDGYRAVVVGTPLYMFSMLKEARRFLSQHHAALEKVPVAFFALGPTEDKETDWQETRQQLKKVLTGYPWFTPVAVELFGGRFDPTRLGFPYRLIPGLKRMSPSDIRDREKIDAWATDLADNLRRSAND